MTPDDIIGIVTSSEKRYRQLFLCQAGGCHISLAESFQITNYLEFEIWCFLHILRLSAYFLNHPLASGF